MVELVRSIEIRESVQLTKNGFALPHNQRGRLYKIFIQFEDLNKINIDIIKSVKEKYKEIKVIAFSAQLNDDLNYDKIIDKNSDFLVINNLQSNDFGSENNKISIIDQNNLIFESGEENKNTIAKHIINNTF